MTETDVKFVWNSRNIVAGDVIVLTKSDEYNQVITRTGPVRWDVPFNGFYKALCLGGNSLRALYNQDYVLVEHYEVGR